MKNLEMLESHTRLAIIGLKTTHARCQPRERRS